jgi:hypothetical protein
VLIEALARAGMRPTHSTRSTRQRCGLRVATRTRRLPTPRWPPTR